MHQTFIKHHRNCVFDEMFYAFEMNHNFEKFRKEEKIVFDVVWWSLFSSKLLIKQILLYQTSFACLMHLSRISSNNLFFITTLSAKLKRLSVFRTFLTFECSKKPKKQNKIKTGHFSKTNHQVMSSVPKRIKSITSIGNISLKPNRSSILNSLMLLKHPLSRLLLIQLLVLLR